MTRTRHPVQWRAPSPAWPSLGATDTGALVRPALLRFHSDTFMDDLARLLQTRPRELPTKVATPITFRLAGPRQASDAPATLDHLKLYHPAHGDFYLVAASLVCATPGLPDRGLDTAAGDRTAFVLRRLAGATELAWVDDPSSATGRSWQPVEDGARAAVATGEDLLPMSPVNFVDGEEKRRLLVGYIPTASKESYVASATIDPQPTLPADPRFVELDTGVVSPLAVLKQHRAETAGLDRFDSSLFVLLDLAKLILDAAPALWQALVSAAEPAPGPARTLYKTLADTSASGTTTWRSALVQAWAQRRDIEGESGKAPTFAIDLANTALDPTLLRTQVQAILPRAVSGAAPAVAPLPVPKLDPRGAARYVLRCAYLRPQCGALHPDVVSAPSEQFAIADFFDFDAPSRDIQIVLPVDTSMKDLRKFQRNVSFVISDQLRRQIGRLSPMSDMSQGKAGPDPGPTLGWICTMSIPIITICALLVLFIFLIIFNIIFWWLPFVRVCFPLPLKGK